VLLHELMVLQAETIPKKSIYEHMNGVLLRTFRLLYREEMWGEQNWKCVFNGTYLSAVLFAFSGQHKEQWQATCGPWVVWHCSRFKNHKVLYSGQRNINLEINYMWWR